MMKNKKFFFIANDELLFENLDYNHYVICWKDEAVKSGTILFGCKFESLNLFDSMNVEILQVKLIFNVGK